MKLNYCIGFKNGVHKIMIDLEDVASMRKSVVEGEVMEVQDFVDKLEEILLEEEHDS